MRGTLIAAFASAMAFSQAAFAEPVKIGYVTTLSGPAAAQGGDMRDAFILALKKAGAKDVSVVVEDDAQKPEVAVQIADKLVESEKIDILTGIIWSNLALAVAPNVMRRDVFYVSSNPGPSQLAGTNCNKNYFNVSYQNDNFYEAAGEYANRDFKKIFLMVLNSPAGKDAAAGFKRYYKGELAGELLVPVSQTDYATEIAQIRASGTDGLFFFLPGGLGIAFNKQFAQSGIKVPIMGPAFSFSQDILPAVGDSVIGARSTASWSPDLDNSANKEFVSAFKEEYGRLPSIYAAQSWDSANLILSALKKADVKDKDAFRKALETADFASVRGKFKFNTNHHPIQDIYLREVAKIDGVLTNRIVEKVLSDHGDVYAERCKM
ncbi:ABC transporter substrate-binding protein [Ensifer sp. ENS05]|uniref:ABC transporter substrate-binding protein n=1 Tax=Ensifer sp. ENS05 TaxID=2769277 RepID=UPI00177E23DE|nr:ABC transporter substrate-binding protein [Ensifer sp. ENS05]MBD9596878.1 ABC transporter substrate-binding protein [Ensifer sp. ENS05]